MGKRIKDLNKFGVKMIFAGIACMVALIWVDSTPLIVFGGVLFALGLNAFGTASNLKSKLNK